MPDFDINDYKYELPKERIAQRPLKNRSDSKLLYYNNGIIVDEQFNKLDEFLGSNDHLIFNETKVIPARLQFFKESGAAIEVFCLEPYDQEHAEAMASRNAVRWKCMIGNARKWKSGSLRMTLEGEALIASVIERAKEGFVLEFNWNSGRSFAEVLELAGKVPIPPYLERPSDELDKLRYQSVLARNNGAVAAPTASLHFDQSILEKLEAKGVSNSRLTLHVGAGTFKPIQTADVREHKMHAEKVIINGLQLAEIIETIEKGKRLICVGTTALRSLESLYWIAHKNAHINELSEHLEQDYCYETSNGAEALILMRNLYDLLQRSVRESLSFSTSLMIRPGYPFQLCKCLITNFHMPGSSLLLLVAAMVGEDWKKVYRHALQTDYRFLSYGDSSLLVGK